MKKNTIMIVDDNKEFLEEMKEMLKLAGYDSLAVDNSEMALEVARRTKPKVILLDLKMPKKNGFQLANELRRLPGLDKTSIIAMSAFYSDKYKILLDMSNIKKCLTKPFRPLDVISEIEGALVKHKTNAYYGEFVS